MFYYASKFIWFLIQPSSFLILLCLLAAFLAWRGKQVAARWAITSLLLLFLVLGLSPFGNWIILPLEQRFEGPQAASGTVDGEKKTYDGILVLGGASETVISAARRSTALNEAGERMTEVLILARRYPDLPIIFSGGSASFFFKDVAEAQDARSFFAKLGIDPKRVQIEDKSRNTYENAVFTRRVLGERAKGNWILITSAFHMPRAVGCFRRAGVRVTPWPVDYRTRGWQDVGRFFDKPSEGLRRSDLALREWVGLFAYWLTGKTSAFLPAPK